MEKGLFCCINKNTVLKQADNSRKIQIYSQGERKVKKFHLTY